MANYVAVQEAVRLAEKKTILLRELLKERAQNAERGRAKNEQVAQSAKEQNATPPNA